ncbi:hypothetical protein O181_027893 [Austropuccinia psidii MF-1]|uniref:RING-type E3 ubiquitin transferase n=1 Tax=Austropuccinia psidii MF-1 TaxID=1389203 RepID=A0A9Q3CQG1_9BASI|nr:hypothetical protein [Austropuccinia psidii MF-1]
MTKQSKSSQGSPQKANNQHQYKKSRFGKQFGALLTSEDGQPQSQSSSLPLSPSIPHSMVQDQSLNHDNAQEKEDSKSNNRKKNKKGCSRQKSNQCNKPECDLNSSNKSQPANSKQCAKKKAQAQSHLDNRSSVNAQIEDDNDNPDICLICAEPIKLYALGVCSHRTCHVCMIRMRALYKNWDCTLCKTNLPEVIFTTDPSAPYSSYDLSKLTYKDPHLSIACETFEQLDQLLSFLKFNCPHPDCSCILASWKALKSHTISAHGLQICNLCSSNKKIFAHEHNLFTNKALATHMNQGSVGIGVGLLGSKDSGSDESCCVKDGFKGHPKCGFCNIYFFDDDQLHRHCREKHEQCFICVQNGVGRWQYYLDYNHLENHFLSDHYLCNQSSCLTARFVVYPTALELQAHQIEAHGIELSNKAMKDARKIQTHFVYAGVNDPQSMQALQRQDQTTHQQRVAKGPRVMNIAPTTSVANASNLSNANRTVPGLGSSRANLNNNNNTKKPDKGKSQAQQPENSKLPLFLNLINLNEISGSSSSNKDSNVLQHVAFIESVRAAVNGVETKVASFKVAARTFYNNEMSAPDFIDTLCSIFDRRSDIIESILNDLLGLLDMDSARKTELLEKWFDLDLEQSQFPSLDGRTSNVSGAAAKRPNTVASKAASWARRTAVPVDTFDANYPQLVGGSSKTQINPGSSGLATRTVKVGPSAAPWCSGGKVKNGGTSSSPSVPSATQASSIKPTTSQNMSTKGSLTSRSNKDTFPALHTSACVERPAPMADMSTRFKNALTSPRNVANGSNGHASSWVTNEISQPTSSNNKRAPKLILFSNSRDARI